jgi:hypothetical protein
MMDDPERIAKTETVFREVNEVIAKTAEQLAADETEFVCECGDADCADRIPAPLDDYESVREHPTRFLLKDGHEKPLVEKVVRRTEDYSVVEKVEQRVAAIARRLDPRAEPA